MITLISCSGFAETIKSDVEMQGDCPVRLYYTSMQREMPIAETAERRIDSN